MNIKSIAIALLALAWAAAAYDIFDEFYADDPPAAPVAAPAPVGAPVEVPAPVAAPVGTPVDVPAPVAAPVGIPVDVPAPVVAPVGTPVDVPAPVVADVNTTIAVSAGAAGIQPAKRGDLPLFSARPGDNTLFAVRPEFTLIVGEISTVGVDAEWGVLGGRGFYRGCNASVGANYFGGGMSAGYLFDMNEEDMVKSAIGGSVGYHHALWGVSLLSEAGERLSREIGGSMSWGGVFWKMLFGVAEREGADHYIDVTFRALFGYTFNSVRYDSKTGDVLRNGGFGTVISAGVGYALVRRGR